MEKLPILEPDFESVEMPVPIPDSIRETQDKDGGIRTSPVESASESV